MCFNFFSVEREWSIWTEWSDCFCEGDLSNKQQRIRTCDIASKNDNGDVAIIIIRSPTDQCTDDEEETRACIPTNCEGKIHLI